MSKLVEELKNEHQWLAGKLNEIRRNPYAPTTLDTLASAKKGLLAHLAKEDAKLYPLLKNSSDAKAREIYEMFGNEMKGISAAAVAFFTKYSKENNAQIGPQFIKDLEGLYKVVEGRIASEEMTLYPKYDALEATGGLGTEEAVLNPPPKSSPMAYWIGGAMLGAALSTAVMMILK